MSRDFLPRSIRRHGRQRCQVHGRHNGF
jgi:hypothetical protein